MSIWPRHIDRTGQDNQRPKKGKPQKKLRRRKKVRPPALKRDADKFEAALIAAIGEKAARAYIRRQARRNGNMNTVDGRRAELTLLRRRLESIEAGNVWESDHLGPYTPEEKAERVSALKAQIALLEADQG